MGGNGSGRKGGQATTDALPSLDIRHLARSAALAEGRSFVVQWNNWDSVTFRSDSHRLIVVRPQGEYAIRLERTPRHMGGAQVWFRCPVLKCNRRVAILYRQSSTNSILACRRCYRLAYQCQSETTVQRALRRANKVRRRLQWEEVSGNPEGERPKGMHTATYHRLLAEQQRHALQSLYGFIAIVKRLGNLRAS